MNLAGAEIRVHEQEVQIGKLKAENAALRQRCSGIVCFSCGDDWSIEKDCEKCDQAHRENWTHEWVSPRVVLLTKEIVALHRRAEASAEFRNIVMGCLLSFQTFREGDGDLIRFIKSLDQRAEDAEKDNAELAESCRIWRERAEAAERKLAASAVVDGMIHASDVSEQYDSVKSIIQDCCNPAEEREVLDYVATLRQRAEAAEKQIVDERVSWTQTALRQHNDSCDDIRELEAENAALRQRAEDAEQSLIEMTDKALKTALEAEAERDAALARAEAAEAEIQQTLGRAMGYPRYCDDLKNFPNAKESDGVCVGEHVAASLAMLAAQVIDDLRHQVRVLMNECDHWQNRMDENIVRAEAAEKERDRVRGLILKHGDDPAVFDWGVLQEIDRLETERDAALASAAAMLEEIEAMGQYGAVQGKDPDDEDGRELVGLAYQGSIWGPCAGADYEPYELAESVENWLKERCDKIAVLASDSGKLLLTRLEAAEGVCMAVKQHGSDSFGVELAAWEIAKCST